MARDDHEGHFHQVPGTHIQWCLNFFGGTEYSRNTKDGLVKNRLQLTSYFIAFGLVYLS